MINTSIQRLGYKETVLIREETKGCDGVEAFVAKSEALTEPSGL